MNGHGLQQHSDSWVCDRCSRVFDVNDPDIPECEAAPTTGPTPPSAPVGVDAKARRLYEMIFDAIAEDGSQQAEDACIRAIEAALAQQPAAPHWGNVPELDDEQPAPPSGEAVAWLRMTPDGTPEPLYAAPQQPAGVGGAPQAWISDNDLLKLHESVDEARNIRMSVRRTHTRVHPIYIPALAALQGGRDDG